MGNAFTAIAEEINAAYWNPAGFGFPCNYETKRQIMFGSENHNVWGFGPFGHKQIGYSHQLDHFAVIATTANIMDWGEVERTSETGESLGMIRPWDGVFGVSAGYRFSKGSAIGSTLKYSWSNLGGFFRSPSDLVSPRTFALDLGFLQKEVLGFLNWGVVAQNMGPAIVMGDVGQSYAIPFVARSGVAADLVFRPVRLLLSYDASRGFEKDNRLGPPDPFYYAVISTLRDETWKEGWKQVTQTIGMELELGGSVSIRAGRDITESLHKWTDNLQMGFGFRCRDASFDVTLFPIQGAFISVIYCF